MLVSLFLFVALANAGVVRTFDLASQMNSLLAGQSAPLASDLSLLDPNAPWSFFHTTPEAAYAPARFTTTGPARNAASAGLNGWAGKATNAARPAIAVNTNGATTSAVPSNAPPNDAPVPPGQVVINPEPNVAGARVIARWTAPSTGSALTATITGQRLQSVAARIVITNPYGDPNSFNDLTSTSVVSFSYTQPGTIMAGDVIDFYLENPSGAAGGLASLFNAQITYTDDSVINTE